MNTPQGQGPQGQGPAKKQRLAAGIALPCASGFPGYIPKRALFKQEEQPTAAKNQPQQPQPPSVKEARLANKLEKKKKKKKQE